MAFIPAGEFLAGWDNGEPDERPERLDFTPGYCVDMYEYPNEKGATPLEAPSYYDAEKLCAAQGKRMCTEFEWERACRGPRATVFTEAQKYVAGDCNLNAKGAVPSGSFASCTNGFGVYDMTGNLWEWSSGTYSEESPTPIIKGGSYQKGPLFSPCYARFTETPDTTSQGDGFRCCADAAQDKNAAAYEKTCPGPRPQTWARKQVLALKRDSDVKEIFYIDTTEQKAIPFSAKAVIIRKDTAQTMSFQTVNGKEKNETNDIDAAKALELINSYKSQIAREQNGNALPSPQCFKCSGTCIYDFGGIESWVGGAGDLAQSFFSEPLISGAGK